MGLSPDALYSAVVDDVSANLVGDQLIPADLPPDVSYKQFVATSLCYDVTRKWVPLNTEEPDRLALEKFLASNKKCRDWCLHLTSSWDEQLFGDFLREIDLFLHPGGDMLFSSYFDFIGMGRTGPGAALGAKGNSLYAKLFSSELTVTSRYLYEMYKDYIKWFPDFSEAEVYRYEKFGDPRIITGSRCSFVPKTSSISRMICVEPSINMFCQLGLGTLLEDRLRNYFTIDLETQPEKNRRLACTGSKDGSYCTIDLSSASDSISLKLCEAIFPAWFFQTLLELRSNHTTYKGTRIPLNMISTMGNGFTFPLQTVIFSCLVRAAYRSSGLPIYDGLKMNWACFGDDLICDSRCYRNVIRLLDMLGFSTNSSKTFSEGRFRESCGADWFDGQPARSVYIKELRSPQDIFVAINLLNGWSAYTGICLNKTIHYLLDGLSSFNRTMFVPFDENNDSGIRVPSILLSKRLRRDTNSSLLYEVYRSRSKRLLIRDGDIRVPKGGRRLAFNPSGLYVSFLFGELVSFTVNAGFNPHITIRHDRVLYRKKLRCTPFWDYIPVDNLINGTKLSWQQWETAVMINFINP
jgi:hypothetical protein